MILSWSIEAEINLNLRKWAENLPRLESVTNVLISLICYFLFFEWVV